jgi:hypothetical protein
MDSIEGLVRPLNEQARAVVLEDGRHSSMFFLCMSSGEVLPSLLAITSRADMPAGWSPGWIVRVTRLASKLRFIAVAGGRRRSLLAKPRKAA